MGFGKNYIDDSDRNVIDEMDDAVVDDSKNTELRDLYKSDDYYDPSRYGDISNRHMCDEGEHNHDISERKYQKPEPEYYEEDDDEDYDDDEEENSVNSGENFSSEDLNERLEKIRAEKNSGSNDASLKTEEKILELVGKIESADKKVKSLNIPSGYGTENNSVESDKDKLNMSKKFTTGIVLIAIGLFTGLFFLMGIGALMALKAYREYNKESEDEKVKKAVAIAGFIIFAIIVILIFVIYGFLKRNIEISEITELLGE